MSAVGNEQKKYRSKNKMFVFILKRDVFKGKKLFTLKYFSARYSFNGYMF